MTFCDDISGGGAALEGRDTYGGGCCICPVADEPGGWKPKGTAIGGGVKNRGTEGKEVEGEAICDGVKDDALGKAAPAPNPGKLVPERDERGENPNPLVVGVVSGGGGGRGMVAMPCFSGVVNDGAAVVDDGVAGNELIRKVLLPPPISPTACGLLLELLVVIRWGGCVSWAVQKEEGGRGGGGAKMADASRDEAEMMEG